MLLPPPGFKPPGGSEAALPLVTEQDEGEGGAPAAAASVAAGAVGVAQPPQHLTEHLVAEGRVGVEQHQLLPGERAAQAGRTLEVAPGVLIAGLQPADQPPLHEALAGGAAAAPGQADGGVQVPQGT